MSRHGRALVSGTLAWVACSVVWGGWFVWQKTNLPDAEGYETEWQFQALMFVYTHGIVLLLALVLLLGILHELYRRNGNRR